MILEIDAGNTRLKWRLLSEDARYRDSGFFKLDDVSSIKHALKQGEEIAAVYISSVADSDSKVALSTAVELISSAPLKFAVSQKNSGGLTNSYQQPDNLGVDRWLAMLAAFSSDQKAVCVIDCGTALTIDFVSSEGLHLGGYILPGMEMMKTGLLQSTAEIAPAYTPLAANRSLKLGCSTTEAIEHGRLLMSVAAIEKALTENDLVDVNVYLTGGDAAVLLDYLPPIFNAVLWPDLVMDGLGVFFGYRPT